MRALRSVVLVLVVMSSATAFADTCERYECRILPDIANCWIRVGSNAQNFPLAMSCQGTCDCMPDTSGSGSLNCSCYCTYNYCYEV